MLLLSKLFSSINRKSQVSAVLLIFAITLSSITELLSIALFVPFISIILGNEEVNKTEGLFTITKYFENNVIIFLIISVFIISGSIRIFTLIWQNKFAARVSNEIIYKAYDVILNEDYTNHIEKSKTNLITTIHTFGNYLFTNIIIPFLYLFESIIFLSLVSISLLLYNWKIFISILFVLLLMYALLFKKANKILKSSSLKQAKLNEKLLERLDIELNAIEYIHLGNYQSIFSNNYRKYDKEYKLDFAKYLITARFPRILIEYIILILILSLILFLYLTKNITNTLPLIASGAFLAQKSFPYLQKIFENWSSIAQHKYAVLSILNYSSKFEKSKKNTYYPKPIYFENIKFKNVSFSYKNNSQVLNKINFSIKKGEKIAIMGPSGTGKTTLLRLICGLLIPTSGEVLINNNAINQMENKSHTLNWMRSIGYVPQKINLTGRTLRENIIFNNMSRKNRIGIEEIIKITLLDDLVKRCHGLDTNIFQNTFSLSGGEHQRLAIARAIYHNPDLLIMDEPTSSLDTITQKKLFDNLKELTSMTCIVITHRVETKYFFDKILEINGKKVFENKSFK